MKSFTYLKNVTAKSFNPNEVLEEKNKERESLILGLPYKYSTLVPYEFNNYFQK